MAVFKDDKIAAQALSGNVQFNRRPWKFWALRGGIALAAVCVLGLGAYVALTKRSDGLAPLSRVTPAAETAAPATARPAATGMPIAPAAAATIPAVHTDARPAPTSSAGVVVELPPEELRERKVLIQSARATPRPSATYGSLSPALAELRSGRADNALTWLQKNGSANKATSEQLVLEGRALLALGKLDEARVRFEKVALLPANTETGADALMGNFLALAGTATRCDISELEQVRGGAPSWGNATATLEAAKRLEAAAGGDLAKLEEARAVYQQALDMEKLEAPAEAECVERLTALANQLILNPRTPCSAPKAVFQKVEAGDTVEKIARKNKVNIGQIKVINKLNDKLVIRFGQVLKMLPGDVVYKVNRTALTGTLTIDGVFIRRYPVGIGPGNATPVGEFTIETKLVNPDWWYEGKHVPFGDPKNILGTRWMGFAASEKIPQGAGIGVHGTSVPESVPGRESKGCVRMLNKDVEELYDLMPQGGTVLIVD